jgi:hypothetical protein
MQELEVLCATVRSAWLQPLVRMTGRFGHRRRVSRLNSTPFMPGMTSSENITLNQLAFLSGNSWAALVFGAQVTLCQGPSAKFTS